MKTPRIRLSQQEHDLIINQRNSSSVLVVGDLHAPFIRRGYFDHCLSTYKKHGCTQVVFIGDVVDNHYSSYHPSDPDGYSAGDELQRAIDMLQPWHKAFPDAKVTLGNHDRIPARKVYDNGLSDRWMKGYRHVLKTPSWDFVDHHIIDEVLYVHGDGSGQAHIRARKELMSVVQGHFHSACTLNFFVGRNYRVFGMQVGCGVDDDSYAMAYGKNHPRSIIACAVVKEGGTLPIIEPMKL